ncbi:multiple epidermal growth factor-like domains protein 10 isoform X2 [Patiria miniata]|uniref:EGF-like domain-containing protein n=1 Tax=Patiria miniata TaxID=46514 RepID=A0A914BPZ3_PATMI|nr:multiple epidermal growth factor-like domains protein 10 isoform X2 [Patiria miniata]
MAVFGVLRSDAWLIAFGIVMFLSVGFAEPESFHVRRLQRATCGGPPSQVNHVCRWSGLECPCVNGTYCSTTSHTCEVCQTTTADCTSPCQYPCHNGGHCVWETGSCECPPEFWGVDCSSRRKTPVPGSPEVTTTNSPVPDPDPDVPPSPCRGRQCLNGGRCEDGQCICQTGYDLPDCSLCVPRWHARKCLDHCSLECKNGDCLTVHKRCHCSVDYTGEDCNLCVPAKAYMNCTNLCSPMCVNGATCNAATHKCECARGWMGEACSQACPWGTYGLNCLQRCQCPIGSCDPITGRCLCGAESQGSPDCTAPCDCLVDGVCYSPADCPTGNIPNRLPPTAQTVFPNTTAKHLQGSKLTPSGQGKPMMTLVVATAAGAAFLLIVVVILIVCLVRTRRENARKPGRNQEAAERVPMTDAVAGNPYDDASSLPVPPAQHSSAPFRPTSGYEDVKELHQNMPDLLQKHAEANDISPYATTGNVTVHAENGPSEYSYVSVDELKVLKGEGEAAVEESYDRLDFLPRERSIRRPVDADGVYSSLQDDGSYEDASSYPLTGPPVGDHQGTNSESSGYARMSPSPLGNRKASSLKSPRKELLLSETQRKGASLKLPRKESAGDKQAYENAYVGFDPKRSSKDASGSPRMNVPPPPPPDQGSHQQKPETDASSGKKAKSEIPQYAKPMKRKSQQQADQQEIPHYAKPNKPKSEIPQYAKPNKRSSSGASKSSPADFQVRLERPLEGNEVPSKVAAGYAHLMHAESPEPDNSKWD